MKAGRNKIAQQVWPGWLKALHWVIALGLLLTIMLGLLMTFASGEAVRSGNFDRQVLGLSIFGSYQLHKSIGISLFILILARLFLRVWLLRTTPDFGHSGIVRVASWSVQVALYALMVSLPVTGWVMTSASTLAIPTRLFGLVELPHLLSPDAKLELIFARLHSLGAYCLLGLAGLHIIAALKHHFYDHDNTLRAMLPQLRKQERKR